MKTENKRKTKRNKMNSNKCGNGAELDAASFFNDFVDAFLELVQWLSRKARKMWIDG